MKFAKVLILCCLVCFCSKDRFLTLAKAEANSESTSLPNAGSQTVSSAIAYAKLIDISSNYEKNFKTNIVPSKIQFAYGSPYETVANDTLQILGQIVVDRASQAALDLLSEKLQNLLNCQVNVEEVKKRSDVFIELPLTCAQLSNLRIQDIAAAPKSLQAAFVADLLNSILENGKWEAIIKDIFLPTIMNQEKEWTNEIAPLVFHRIMDIAIENVNNKQFNNNGEQAFVLAFMALAKCRSLTVTNMTQKFENCPILEFIDELANQTGFNDAKHDAQILAIKVQSLFAIKKIQTRNEIFRNALDVVFEVAALLDNSYENTDIVYSQHMLPLIRQFSIAFLDKDTNSMMTSVFKMADFYLITEVNKAKNAPVDEKQILENELKKVRLDLESKKRGFRFLASLMQYSQTYLGEDPVSKDSHDARKAILESLTLEMTSRKGRSGDWVASLGGSLQLVGGQRFGGSNVEGSENSNHRAFWGPFSLPLGIGLDKYLQHEDLKKPQQGFHFLLGIFDLGQYLSFTDDGGVVEDIEYKSAISPSLTAGYFWGTEFPFYIGLSGGYSPYYDFTPKEDNKPEIDDKLGGWNLGISAGIYVPLFDFN